MKRRQNGMALVLVLWLVVLLGIMAAGHSRNAHTDTRLASQQVQAAKARGLAEAGINHIILEMLAARSSGEIPIDGSVFTRRVGEQTVTLAVRDTLGLVDLNAADAVLLDTVLRAAGAGEERRLRLIDAIQDWRDKDDLTRLNGYEDADFEAAGVPWTSRDAAFTAVDELKYLPGMTQDVFERLSPLVTVHSGRGRFNPDLAPPVLAAAVRGDLAPSAEPTGNNAPVTARNGTYHIYASAGGTVAIASLEAVVSISRSSKRPFTILEWREPSRQVLPPVPGDEE